MNYEYALKVQGLTVTYDNRIALLGVSASIKVGTLLGIVGPNGAGKTTFVRALLNLIPCAAGTVNFFGGSYYEHQHRIAYIPQRSSIDWDFPLLVIDVVLMGAYRRTGWLRGIRDEERIRALAVLEQVGMRAYADRHIGALSGGQQQRLLLARALMQDADLYFMDEPFVGIDEATEHFMAHLFKSLCSRGKTMLVVHHNMQTVAHYFDEVMLLDVTCRLHGPTRCMMDERVTLHDLYER